MISEFFWLILVLSLSLSLCVKIATTIMVIVTVRSPLSNFLEIEFRLSPDSACNSCSEWFFTIWNEMQQIE